MEVNKGATANRRPAGQLGGSDNLSVIVAVGRAFPAAVAELDRWSMSTRVIPRPEPPPMETGAPLPVIQRIGESLVVAYVCRNLEFPGWDSGAPSDHPGFDIWSAVLRFDGVTWHHFGAPNDEALATHPFYSVGLGFYGFREVVDSPRIPVGSTSCHWVVTFHDETLEVVASSAFVVSRRDEGEDTHAVALKYAQPLQRTQHDIVVCNLGVPWAGRRAWGYADT